MSSNRAGGDCDEVTDGFHYIKLKRGAVAAAVGTQFAMVMQALTKSVDFRVFAVWAACGIMQ